MKKIIPYLLLLFLSVFIFLGINRLILFINEEKIRNAVVEITYIDDLSTPFLSDVKVSDFITSINGNIIDDYKINTTSIGQVIINYKYINDDNIKLEESFNLNIVDVTSPIVWLSGSYTVNVGYSYDLASKILCADDYDDTPTCYIEGEYDLNKIGNYNLKYIATDSSGNSTTKDFTLYVIKPTKSSYSVSYTNYEDIYNSYKEDNNKIGIDVSAYQGDIDFDKLKENNVEFAMIRVGSKNKDGYFVDSKFIQNIEGFNRVNIPVGVYFYSYANSDEEALEDAKWVIDQVKDYNIELPIVYDWENWSSYNRFNLSIYHLNTVSDIFMNYIEKSGYKSMLYGSKNYLETFWNTDNKNIWLAHYTSKTSYEGDYMMWQLSSNGKVDGINGAVDLDILYIKENE